MKKSLLAYLSFGLFLIFSLLFVFFYEKNVVLGTSANFATSAPKVNSKNLVASPINTYFASSQVSKETLAAIGVGDARPVIVDNFLASNDSPMAGLGNIFVAIADKYQLDYRLLPAIAFQESTLGKKMPKGSHNAFGWAIYTGQNSGAYFRSWEQAIDSVAQGLKANYVDEGLKTPDAIMTRYSPDNDGSWAYGVKFAIDEMSVQ